MITIADRLETQLDAGIEALQEILADGQLDVVSYEDAKELGYELLAFFEVFDEPGKDEE